jgi:hypothetical protein
MQLKHKNLTLPYPDVIQEVGKKPGKLIASFSVLFIIMAA